jgi:microcystin-dependent protein
MWTTPRTWVVGELVTASIMNTHVRDQLNAIGMWVPGDLKLTYVSIDWDTWAQAWLNEPHTGWYLANGADFAGQGKTALQTALGGTTLPDFRDRAIVAPGPVNYGTRGNAAGSATHTLSTGELPAHAHDAGGLGVAAGNVPGGGGAGGNNMIGFNERTNIQDYRGVEGATANAGGGAAHENRMPFRTIGAVLIKY